MQQRKTLDGTSTGGGSGVIDGTIANPSPPLASNSASGLYDGGDKVGIAVDGVSKVLIDPTYTRVKNSLLATGDATMQSNLFVNNNANVSNNLFAGGSLSIVGASSLQDTSTGNLSVGGNLTVSGTVGTLKSTNAGGGAGFGSSISGVGGLGFSNTGEPILYGTGGAKLIGQQHNDSTFRLYYPLGLKAVFFAFTANNQTISLPSPDPSNDSVLPPLVILTGTFTGCNLKLPDNTTYNGNMYLVNANSSAVNIQTFNGTQYFGGQQTTSFYLNAFGTMTLQISTPWWLVTGLDAGQYCDQADTWCVATLGAKRLKVSSSAVTLYAPLTLDLSSLTMSSVTTLAWPTDAISVAFAPYVAVAPASGFSGIITVPTSYIAGQIFVINNQSAHSQTLSGSLFNSGLTSSVLLPLRTTMILICTSTSTISVVTSS